MHIAYFDESGDDGYPQYSSALFVLSTLYLHHLNWRGTFEALQAFRRELKKKIGLPTKWELHTRNFLLGKKPYRALGLSTETRIDALESACELIANLDLKIVNVVIAKRRITKPDYDVLDTALTYSIQRIENDLNPEKNPEAKLLVITDEGRVGKMRKTSRRIQRFNPIKSKFGAASYRKEIRVLIEDPLPKPSKESYFVQAADLVAFVVYLYAAFETGESLHGRMPAEVSQGKVIEWLERLKPSLNLAAAPKDPFGVKFHPE